MLGTILSMPLGTVLLIGLIIFFFGGTIITAILRAIGMGFKVLGNAIFHK